MAKILAKPGSKSSLIMAPIALGELIDKITVLRIKEGRITSAGRLANIRRELKLLLEAESKYFSENGQQAEKILDLESQLKKFNEEIWEMGDKIRELGEKQNFSKEFAKVAYAIHLANDRRARIKKDINLLSNSPLVEEKSYHHWR